MRAVLLAIWLLVGLAGSTAWADRSAFLSWWANPEPDIAGYRIFWGTASRAYSFTNDVGNVTNAIVPGLWAGNTYFFAATAYNLAGLESDFSDEVSLAIAAGVPAGSWQVVIESSDDLGNWTARGTNVITTTGTNGFLRLRISR